MLKQVANIGSTLFSRVKWFMLYYFVIQAQEVRIRVQAESQEEYSLKQGVWRRKKYFILTLFLFASVIILMSTFLNNTTSYQGS